ncbi:2-oxo-4-hydroxy-4-carboxy-5-ureidoimidazoline decarboxylase, partial [Micromonospora sp. M51]|uniref:2-oxo-4-hydroxy-4-carboxy-5-ureidoimidazoline decarboxylase n=1 Tax=Micromonospora sp. M51 TaxID=2824889 RepID=UPI001B39881B
NVASPDEADDVVRSAADVDSWVRAVVSGRPYADLDTLLGHADQLAHAWAPADVAGALAQHPRIGERHRGGGADAQLSAVEQSGVGDDADVAERLRIGNEAYEERFGHVFLIRAAGRSGEEILEALEKRLGNDPAGELDHTALELREIAGLRLRSLLS